MRSLYGTVKLTRFKGQKGQASFLWWDKKMGQIRNGCFCPFSAFECGLLTQVPDPTKSEQEKEVEKLAFIFLSHHFLSLTPVTSVLPTALEFLFEV